GGAARAEHLGQARLQARARRRGRAPPAALPRGRPHDRHARGPAHRLRAGGPPAARGPSVLCHHARRPAGGHSQVGDSLRPAPHRAGWRPAPVQRALRLSVPASVNHVHEHAKMIADLYTDRMSRTVTATEAKAKILALLDDVAAGDELEITKH